MRPEFLPLADAAAGPSRDGILAWRMLLTDKKNMAILHLVASSRKALDAILNDKRSDIRVFEIGKLDKRPIEEELQKYRKDFSLDNFEVSVQ